MYKANAVEVILAKKKTSAQLYNSTVIYSKYCLSFLCFYVLLVSLAFENGEILTSLQCKCIVM